MTQTPDDAVPAAKPIRLQRFLAQCGLGSRRECEELITSGRIEIDGQPVTELGTAVEPGRRKITLDGELIKVERKKYYMLNKPPGFLCTAKDPAGRPVVLDLFPQQGPRLFTVGRLDENTTGLLIVTNDGDLAQRLAHPRYRIYRLYRAQVAGDPAQEVFDQLRTGFFFTEGKFRVHDIRRAKKQGKSTWVEVTMTEGQNREIRRLFARVGHKVMKLERIGFGPIRLGRLPLGEFRELRLDELQELHGILDRNERERRTPPPADRKRPPSSRGGAGRPRTSRDGEDRRKTSRSDEDRSQTARGGEGRRRTSRDGAGRAQTSRGGAGRAQTSRGGEGRAQTGGRPERRSPQEGTGRPSRAESGNRSRPVAGEERRPAKKGGPKKAAGRPSRPPRDQSRRRSTKKSPGPRRPKR